MFSRATIALLGLAFVAQASGALASKASLAEGETLMKKSDCFSCHQVKRKVVGPSFIDIAKKYKSKKAAVSILVKKIKEGGSGTWGAVPMAAHASLPDADIDKMVKWVLAQK